MLICKYKHLVTWKTLLNTHCLPQLQNINSSSTPNAGNTSLYHKLQALHPGIIPSEYV